MNALSFAVFLSLNATPVSPLAGELKVVMCRELRRVSPETPVMLLLARSAEGTAAFSLKRTKEAPYPDEQTSWLGADGKVFCTDGGITGGDCIKKLKNPQAREQRSGTARTLTQELVCSP